MSTLGAAQALQNMRPRCPTAAPLPQICLGLGFCFSIAVRGG